MKPIIIVGAGIAGLAAAESLRRAGHKPLLIERGATPGGRTSSLAGADWLVDVGCPYFKLSDRNIVELVRVYGLQHDCVAVQDGIFAVRPGEAPAPRPEGYGGNRVTLRGGWVSLFSRATRELPLLTGLAVGAVRWEADHRHFLLRDSATGRTLRHPVTDQPLEAAGLILAVPGPEARRMVEASAPLAPTAPALSTIRPRRTLVGIFRMPRVDAGYYALEGTGGHPIGWLAFEERKCPGRVPADSSLLVVRASDALAASTWPLEESRALERLWYEARMVIRALPDRPTEQRLVRWDGAEAMPHERIAIPEEGIATEPAHLPVALAGDYLSGGRADLAAASGRRAANQVAERLRAAAHR